MFEPLDALYTAMYGTRPGYNVPSDISTYWNGTERWVCTTQFSGAASTQQLQQLYEEEAEEDFA